MQGPLMIGIRDKFLSEQDVCHLKHPLVGGVILFARNFESPEQLSALTASIHMVKPNILIAVDQEGGRVQRFKAGFTLLPPPGMCGKLYDKDPMQGLVLAKLLGELMALEVLSCGVDISFAPLLDIDNGQSKIIGDRAFHQDPDVVAKLGAAFIEGMNTAGMQAVGKHFPGHGSVVNDTHLNTAIDPRPLNQIEAFDLTPFKACIDKGLPGIMVAHVIYQSIDNKPAGFSIRWLQEILRQKLGFNGVIFSDDMGMMAAKHFGNSMKGIEAALGAGCDMVLLCNEFEVIDEALHHFAMQPALDRKVKLAHLKPKKPALSYQELKHSLHWQGLVAKLAMLSEL